MLIINYVYVNPKRLNEVIIKHLSLYWDLGALLKGL